VYQMKLSSVQFELVRVSDEPEFGTTENCCTFTTKVKKERTERVLRHSYKGHEVPRDLGSEQPFILHRRHLGTGVFCAAHDVHE